MGNSNKIILFVALGLVLLAITVAFVVSPFSDNSLSDNISSNSSSSNIFLECGQNEEFGLYSELSVSIRAGAFLEAVFARQKCYNDNALTAIQNGNSIDELHKLSKGLEKQPRKERAIGRAILIFSDYNLGTVLEACKANSCSFAFYHGLTQEWGKYDPSRTSEFEKFVASFCDFKGSTRGRCYHHLGHYYFYTSPDKNFESGLAICNALKDNTDLFWCGYGVIHQYFEESDSELAVSTRVGIYDKLSDFFDRCAGYTDRRAGVCYENASYRHAKQAHKLEPKNVKIERVIKECDVLTAKIPVEFNRCYDGVRRTFMTGKEWRATTGPELCEAADTSFGELCLNGLSSSWPYEADQDGGHPF